MNIELIIICISIIYIITCTIMYHLYCGLQKCKECKDTIEFYNKYLETIRKISLEIRNEKIDAKDLDIFFKHRPKPRPRDKYGRYMSINKKTKPLKRLRDEKGKFMPSEGDGDLKYRKIF